MEDYYDFEDGREDDVFITNTSKEVVASVFGIVVIFALGLAIANGISALVVGEVSTASDYASFASGIATMILVGITGWYTYATRELVSESRRTRLQEQKRLIAEKRAERDALRKSLLNEIRSIENFEEMKADNAGVSIFHNTAPTTVYQNNAASVGKLTEEEIKAVSEYYVNLNNLRDFFFGVRENLIEWDNSQSIIFETVDEVVESQEEAIEILENAIEESNE